MNRPAARQPLHRWNLLVGASRVQLRPLCNLLDIMVAVEGGQKSKLGGSTAQELCLLRRAGVLSRRALFFS
jgi:hypothetical protein